MGLLRCRSDTRTMVSLVALVFALILNLAYTADKMHFPDEASRHSRQVASDGCDITISEEEGWLFSPNYPSNYDNQRDCTYVIKKWRRNVCQIQLTINDFDLGDSANCRSDYLDIRQGRPNSGSNLLCGSVPTGTKKKLTFPRGRNTMTLRFHSDVSRTYKGFMIKIKQISNSCNRGDDQDDPPAPNPPNPPVLCDKYVSEYNGVITSPDYPDDYPPNSRCRYTIQKPDRGVCKVEVIFRAFELEQSPSCRNDFLEIPGGARLCGVYLTPSVLEYLPGTNSMTLTFFSDGYGSAPGFEAEVRQLRNSCGRDKPPKPVYPEHCDRDILSLREQIVSPNFPFGYPPGQRCRYLIRRFDPSVCAVVLTLVFFEVTGAIYGCYGSHLTLPDSTRLCGTLTGQKTLYFNGGDKFLSFEFITDWSGYGGRGFDIRVNQIPHSCGGHRDQDDRPGQCDRTITREVDVIRSPNYPSDYPNGARCVYNIRKASSDVCEIRLDFLDFDLAKPNGRCDSDYLEIENLQQKLCGKNAAAEKVVYFPPSTDTMQLIFKSSSYESHRGFEIRVNQLRNSCFKPQPIVDPDNSICGTITDFSAVIQSDNYPNTYNPNTDCAFQIIRASREVCRVELTFVQFHVGSGSNSLCVGDYLEIPGNGRYCGLKNRQTISVDFPSSQRELNIRFKTDSYDQRSGFRIEIRQLTHGCSGRNGGGGNDPVTDCGGTFKEEKFDLISPGFQSGTYPPNDECRYTIKKSNFDICALEIKYNVFDLEASDDCTKDFVEIGDQKVCGKLPFESTRTYEFPEDTLVVRFKSDNFGKNAGFFLSVKQKKC